MAKKQTMSIKEFMSGDYKIKKQKSNVEVIGTVLAATAPALVLIVPKSVFAAGLNSTFGRVHESIMNAIDCGVVLVIIFSGVAWGMGNRTKAIEILIGACCGYILARHAVDIRDFLKGI